MRTIYINSLRHSIPKKNIFGSTITDYYTHEGVVREISTRGNKPPKYRIKSTREPVNVIMI